MEHFGARCAFLSPLEKSKSSLKAGQSCLAPFGALQRSLELSTLKLCRALRASPGSPDSPELSGALQSWVDEPSRVALAWSLPIVTPSQRPSEHVTDPCPPMPARVGNGFTKARGEERTCSSMGG
eukprot:3237723-Alexandrium_andersonii.AAC.1